MNKNIRDFLLFWYIIYILYLEKIFVKIKLRIVLKGKFNIVFIYFELVEK